MRGGKQPVCQSLAGGTVYGDVLIQAFLSFVSFYLHILNWMSRA